jgi:predicted transcriptional regulator
MLVMKTKLLDTITFSEKREKLLILLKEGPKTLEEIRAALNVTSSGMIPQIRKLEQQNLVMKNGKGYILTDIGEIITGVFVPLAKTIDIVTKYRTFLNDHDINAIPKHLLERIHELGECRLVESNVSEIYEPHREFMEHLLKSKNVMGISPIFHSSYPPFFLNLAEKGANVSLLLTKDVFDKIKNEYHDTLSKFISLDNTHLYVSGNNLRLAGAVTETFCSISLFFRSGGYDSQRDLISLDSSAVKWGAQLFHHYVQYSSEIKDL